MQSSNDTLNNEPNDNPAQPYEGGRFETFKVRKGIAGWHLLPADPQRHPLLARLFGHQAVDGVEPQTADWDELRKPLDWASLEEGMALLRRVAKDMGVGLRACGDLRRGPTVQLWRLPQPVVEPMRPVFEDLHGDAAKWGISDFYEENEKALRAALEDKGPFDTGWYGVKKEIQSGRIWRPRRGGPVHIEVSASMDEWPDLVDTAVWAAKGKELGASGGFDVLSLLGLGEDAALAWLEDVAEAEAEGSELGYDNSCSEQAVLSPRIGYSKLCDALDSLMDECEKTLQFTYEGAVESCKARLDALKQDLGASCSNCRHFHPAIGASRVNPEDPADCGHPRYYALLSANKAFPFEKGCKFWVARHPMRPKK